MSDVSAQFHSSYPLVSEGVDWQKYGRGIDFIIVGDENCKIKPRKLPGGGLVFFCQRDVLVNSSKVFIPLHCTPIFRVYKKMYVFVCAKGNWWADKVQDYCQIWDSCNENVSNCIYVKKSRGVDPFYIRTGDPLCTLNFTGIGNQVLCDISKKVNELGVEFYKALPEVKVDTSFFMDLTTPKNIVTIHENPYKRMTAFQCDIKLFCGDLRFYPKEVGPGDFILFAQQTSRQSSKSKRIQKVLIGPIKFSFTEEPMVLQYPIHGSGLCEYFKQEQKPVKCEHDILEISLQEYSMYGIGLVRSGDPVARLVSKYREACGGPSNEFLSRFVRNPNGAVDELCFAEVACL